MESMDEMSFCPLVFVGLLGLVDFWFTVFFPPLKGSGILSLHQREREYIYNATASKPRVRIPNPLI